MSTSCSLFEYWGRAIVARVWSVRQDLWLSPRAGHRKKWFYPSTFVEAGRTWGQPARVVVEEEPAPVVRLAITAGPAADVPEPVVTGLGASEPATDTIGGRAQRVHFGPSVTQEIQRILDEEKARV